MNGKINVARAANLTRIASQEWSDASEQERWLRDLGVTLVDIWFYGRDGWFDEKHVDDHDTLLETVKMTADRMGARYAMWDDSAGWTLLKFSTGDTRCYPHRAAAEMVAIHGG